MTTLMLERDELRSMTDDMWASLISPAPHEIDDVEFPHFTICGHVELLGGWFGCVQVETSVDGAAAIAGQMLDLPIADVALPDLQDALGELANILGGSVKSCIDGQTLLSLPRVEAPQESDADTESLHRVCLSWEGHPIVVRISSGDGAPVHFSTLPGGTLPVA
jgi:chemotaxis protein CheX